MLKNIYIKNKLTLLVCISSLIASVAGNFKNAEGPIKGHNVEPIYFDIELNKNKEFNINLSSTHNSFVYLIEGEIKIGNKSHDNVKDSNLILLTKGDELKVMALTKVKFLLISGMFKIASTSMQKRRVGHRVVRKWISLGRS